MKRLMPITIFSIIVWGQGVVIEAQPAEDTNMCKYGVEHMIKIAKQSLSEASSRPERIKKRRKLVEEWSSRMEKGENPCQVYMDIQKASTTF